MKKLVSLLGIFSISASAGSVVFAEQTKFSMLEVSNKNVSSFNGFESDIDFQINDLKKSYNALSNDEKRIIGLEMAKISELNVDDIKQVLENSNIDFIKNNKKIVETMYLLYDSFIKISEFLSITTQSIDIDWLMINQYINLGFGNSNQYQPSVELYHSQNWWNFWDWGCKIDFPEGDINIVRIIKLLFSLYNGINFEPLESLIKSGNRFFDYLINLDHHGEDKVSVLYDLISEVNTEFQNSGVPFTEEIYGILDKFSSTLEPFKNLKLSIISGIIKLTIKKEIGMSIEEIGLKYSDILNKTIYILHITDNILDLIHNTLSGIIWNFFVKQIRTIANQMIDADQNQNGVSIKFQLLFIPLGFEAR